MPESVMKWSHEQLCVRYAQFSPIAEIWVPNKGAVVIGEEELNL